MHPDLCMHEQIVYVLDIKDVRTVIQAFTKGQCGSPPGCSCGNDCRTQRYRLAQQDSASICTPRQSFTSKGIKSCGEEGLTEEGRVLQREKTDQTRQDRPGPPKI